MKRRELLTATGGIGIAMAALASCAEPAQANAGPLDLHALVEGLSDEQMVVLPQGHHRLARPLRILARNVTVMGFGAVVDHTVEIVGQGVRLLGLTVHNAPGPGFQFKRGQGAHLEGLTARDNDGDGFLLGGRDHSQIAWSQFSSCLAIGNKGHGWHLDGTGSKSWINANTFTACWSRNNGGAGWFSSGKANYNNWFGHQVESNCRTQRDLAPMTLQGNQNLLYGGHVVDTQRSGCALRCTGNGSLVFGGRYVRRIEGAQQMPGT